MKGYITVGSNDLHRAAACYDAFLSELGASRMMEEEAYIVWGTGEMDAAFSVPKTL